MAKSGFADRVFVVTGTLSSLSRKDAEAAIVAAGGRVSGDVSKNTDVLVVGDKPGSKVAKAESLGVEIWDEKKFTSALKRATGSLIPKPVKKVPAKKVPAKKVPAKKVPVLVPGDGVQVNKASSKKSAVSSLRATESPKSKGGKTSSKLEQFPKQESFPRIDIWNAEFVRSGVRPKPNSTVPQRVVEALHEGFDRFESVGWDNFSVEEWDPDDRDWKPDHGKWNCASLVELLDEWVELGIGWYPDDSLADLWIYLCLSLEKWQIVPESLLQRLARTKEIEWRQNEYDFFNLALGEVVNKTPSTIFIASLIVALHPATPDWLLNELMDSSNEFVRAALVQRPFEQGFDRLSRDESDFVRSWLATVPNLPEEILVSLLCDASEAVRSIAFLHRRASAQGRVAATILGVRPPDVAVESMWEWLRFREEQAPRKGVFYSVET